VVSGAAYVDIAGPDTYVKDHGNLAPLFAGVKAIVRDTKLFACTSAGRFPICVAGSRFGMVVLHTWTADFIMNETLNPPDFLKRAYNSARFVTRDEFRT